MGEFAFPTVNVRTCVSMYAMGREGAFICALLGVVVSGDEQEKAGLETFIVSCCVFTYQFTSFELLPQFTLNLETLVSTYLWRDFRH